MNLDKNKKAILGLGFIALLMLIIIYLPKSFEQGVPEICTIDGDCQHENYLDMVISYLPAVLVLGFILGVVISYFYFERKAELPIPTTDKKQVILSLLTSSEKKAIEKIIEMKGQVLQSEVSRLEGMGKVRAHRVIERLIRRGVLEKQQFGKTNMIRIRKDIFDALTK
ncbi:hypothetical protein KKF81_00610 [Candidatus Micrarchaeota archaeon]|nr:hypothetical protein [Candidatus Micrarchaeota archaeon]MBU1165420.1 hypothetical protein [Candidatus Micrarchaeota archaeon]MBU1886967.1 hypothetical protein [Candidatus Micrarchaeota archaeon]